MRPRTVIQNWQETEIKKTDLRAIQKPKPGPDSHLDVGEMEDCWVVHNFASEVAGDAVEDQKMRQCCQGSESLLIGLC